MQLDLFLHGRDVMLQNDVIAALRARDVTSSRGALERFAAEFPDHEVIASLRTLLAALASPAGPATDHEQVAARIREIDTVLVPAAERDFGSDAATGWLAPIWSSLANDAARLSFRSECPRAHAGFLYLRSGNWAAAEAHIESISAWRRIPAPLAWMAEARFHRQGLASAWCLLIELAWIDSGAFRDLVRRLHSAPLLRLWNDFEAGFGSVHEVEASWFPAWLLITAPELASVMRESQVGNGKPPERVARLLLELLALEKQGRHAELVAQRRRLRDLHPGLFEYYMSSR